MFKPHNMFNRNLTHRSSKRPTRSFSKEESEEDSMENLEFEEKDSAVGEEEVMNQSSTIHMGYLGITRESALMHSAHTMQPRIIMLKVSLS